MCPIFFARWLEIASRKFGPDPFQFNLQFSICNSILSEVPTVVVVVAAVVFVFDVFAVVAVVIESRCSLWL